MGFCHQFAKLSTTSELNIQRIKVHQGIWNVWILSQPMATISIPLQWLTMRFLDFYTVLFKLSPVKDFSYIDIYYPTSLSFRYMPVSFLNPLFSYFHTKTKLTYSNPICILQSRADVLYMQHKLSCWDKFNCVLCSFWVEKKTESYTGSQKNGTSIQIRYAIFLGWPAGQFSSYRLRECVAMFRGTGYFRRAKLF